MSPEDPDSFLASLTDTSLYSIGAYFADRHPDLLDDVIEQSVDIEHHGVETYADREGITLQSAPDWLKLESVLCVGGSWIVPSGAPDARAIRENATAAARCRG